MGKREREKSVAVRARNTKREARLCWPWQDMGRNDQLIGVALKEGSLASR